IPCSRNRRVGRGRQRRSGTRSAVVWAPCGKSPQKMSDKLPVCRCLMRRPSAEAIDKLKFVGHRDARFHRSQRVAARHEGSSETAWVRIASSARASAASRLENKKTHRHARAGSDAYESIVKWNANAGYAHFGRERAKGFPDGPIYIQL